ncbi:major facilitator superfamily domain-containing protein [Suillus clintonianus]|uniref:major facilitator superfamily domain-containing protein n=1 Tax=Suillus clintonianus TaxID=1904413 RepID=UPI001B868A21|nr:major facilitator superfamily domain-containing protein [Suillus clintonianus]KAG2141295.1 major facilitator superfamily domain-containing protein [Suillus clintonianus]
MSPDPTSQQVDEETPLLQSEENAPKTSQTPLPWRQFSMLLVLQIAEPMAASVISPFAPQLIRDIGITHGDEALVSFYVGLLHSLFFATEALTIFHWSRLSDYIGRKPVLLIGLFGLSLSMFCFGLSKTFWSLVISRCLNGALNGNIGVMKSMTAEMTDSTNLARAWAFIPLAWSSGTTLGPLVGGVLARPADRFPNIFGGSEFLKKYPYFLPCAVPATVSALTWIVVFLYMKETATPQINISQLLPWKKRKTVPSPALESPQVSSSVGDMPVPIRALFVRRVIIATGSYAGVALVDIAFRTVQPVFYATPISLGGLGFDTPTIGTVLAVQGILNGITQPLVFARLHDVMGPKKLWIFAVTCSLPMIALLPASNTLARSSGVVQSVWCLVALQVALGSCMNFAYGISFMYISAASPNRASVGATNGFAQVIVSVMRAIGPAAANSAFSISIEKHYLGGNLVYCVMAGMVCMVMGIGFLLPRTM